MFSKGSAVHESRSVRQQSEEVKDEEGFFAMREIKGMFILMGKDPMKRVKPIIPRERRGELLEEGSLDEEIGSVS